MWLSPATDHSDTSPMSSLLADSYTYREYREHSSSVQALPTDDGLLVLPALGDQQGVQHHCGQQKEIMSANGELPELKRIQVLLPHEGKEVSRKHAIKPQISLDGHHEVGAGKVRHGGVCLPIVQAQETENLNIILTVWQKLRNQYQYACDQTKHVCHSLEQPQMVLDQQVLQPGDLLPHNVAQHHTTICHEE